MYPVYTTHRPYLCIFGNKNAIENTYSGKNVKEMEKIPSHAVNMLSRSISESVDYVCLRDMQKMKRTRVAADANKTTTAPFNENNIKRSSLK